MCEEREITVFERCIEAERFVHEWSVIALFQQHLRKMMTLDPALALLALNKESVIFVIPKPNPNYTSRTIKYTNVYLVGPLVNVFRYAQAESGKVLLDEVVLADVPAKLHFDIEIKQKIEDVDTEEMCSVLIQYFGCLSIEINDEQIRTLVDVYQDIRSSAFTEMECVEGLNTMQAHLSLFMKKMCGNDENGEESMSKMCILSGCCSSKFSLHIIMNNVYCESQVLTMPLVAYEIARHFQVDNIKCLAEHLTEWCDNGGRSLGASVCDPKP